MKKILIIDSNCIFFRNYFKLNKGLVNGGAFGYVKFLFNENLPDFDYVISAWDGGRSKRRLDLYPGYKASRRKKDEAEIEEIMMQQLICRNFNETLGIIDLFLEGIEADDIIASIVEYISNKGKFEIYIVSSDKDFHQLMKFKRVKIWKPETYKILSKDEIDIDMEFVPILKALAGDNSDNIKGVKGIGEKKGINLLKNYETPQEFMISDFYKQNKEIIDLNLQLMSFDFIPDSDRDKIIKEFKKKIKNNTFKNKENQINFADKCKEIGFESLTGLVFNKRFFV